jgi:putative SOS response-associated peptidase YedK
MCGRFGVEVEYVQLALRWQAQLEATDPGPRYNIAPRSQIPALLLRDDQRVLTAFRWGLVPHWAKDLSIGDRAINARAETVAKLPTFRDAFKRSRCVIPASFFYEWKRADARKIPHVIKRRDGEPMAFAGLTSRWTDKDTGEAVDSCTIVTTAANTFMEPMHTRMPAILDDGAIDAWLEPDQDTEILHSLLVPCPDEWLRAYPVSTLVNSPKNQGPELIVPA